MKKVLILSLALVLVFGSFSFAYAEEKVDNGTTVNCVTAPCPEATTTSVNTLGTTSTTSSNSGSSSSTMDLACVQSAVATREAAMSTAFTKFSGSMTAALSTKATALNSAWGLADAKARREARASAWKAFQTSSKQAKTTFKADKKTAWSTFKTATKTCKVPLAENEGNDLSI